MNHREFLSVRREEFSERCPICREFMALEFHEYPLYSLVSPLDDPFARYVCCKSDCAACPDDDIDTDSV
jgi:hypothetical protein